MAQAAATATHISASFRLSIAKDARGTRFNARARALVQPFSSKSPLVAFSSFASCYPLVVQRSSTLRKSERKAASFCIRCEQSTKQRSAGLDIWVGRLAMVGFVSAVSIEIVTGKGLLEVTNHAQCCQNCKRQLQSTVLYKSQNNLELANLQPNLANGMVKFEQIVLGIRLGGTLTFYPLTPSISSHQQA